jgi:hypothetical protein
MTLTETVILVKKMTPVVVIGGLVMLILGLGFQLTTILISQQLAGSIAPQTPSPSPVAPEEQTFGKLPKLEIPNSKPSIGYTWVMDTLDGTPRFKEAVSNAAVYFIPKKIKSLGFENTIYSMATQVGISSTLTPYEEVEDLATFDDLKRKLSVDTRSFNFRYDYLITAEDNIIIDQPIGLEPVILSAGASFLQKVGRYPDAISSGRTNLLYYRIDPATRDITPLESSEGANAVEINYFLKDVDNIPVVTSSYYGSQNYVFLMKSERDYTPIRASMQHFERSIEQTGRYPLRTPEQAWEDVQQGRGIMIGAPQESGEVRIQRVFMAYFDPNVYQEYFQPVYVFLGENRFAVYVQAIAAEFIQ